MEYPYMESERTPDFVTLPLNTVVCTGITIVSFPIRKLTVEESTLIKDTVAPSGMPSVCPSSGFSESSEEFPSSGSDGSEGSDGSDVSSGSEGSDGSDVSSGSEGSEGCEESSGSEGVVDGVSVPSPDPEESS